MTPQRRRLVAVGVGLVLLVVVVGAVLLTSGDDRPGRPAAHLVVGWGGSEGRPACVYDAADRTAVATIAIDGPAPPSGTVTVTVTAYADENTSRPVGSTSRTVRVDGTVHRSVVVSVPVTRAPHVDEDGVAACALAVEE